MISKKEIAKTFLRLGTAAAFIVAGTAGALVKWEESGITDFYGYADHNLHLVTRIGPRLDFDINEMGIYSTVREDCNIIDTPIFKYNVGCLWESTARPLVIWPWTRWSVSPPAGGEFDCRKVDPKTRSYLSVCSTWEDSTNN